MSKQYCVTFTDFAVEMYLETYTGSNRSRFIEKMFLIGCDTYLGDTENYKEKLITSIRKIHELESKISKQNQQIGRLKELTNRTEEKIKQKQIQEELINHKALRDSIDASGIRETIR